MGIIVAEKVVQSVLKSQFDEGSVSDALMADVFESDVYTTEDINDIKTYFGKHKIHVLPNYPFEDVKAPALYVTSADVSFQENLMDAGELQQTVEEGTKYEVELYKKSTRVVVVANNVTITVVLSTIAQYLLMVNRSTFNQYRMYNMDISYSEFDMLAKFLPQTYTHRSLIATFSVADMYKRETAKVIKGIDIDIKSDDFKAGIPT